MFSIKLAIDKQQVKAIIEERLNEFGVEIVKCYNISYVSYLLIGDCYLQAIVNAKYTGLDVTVYPNYMLQLIRNQDGYIIKESEDLDLIIQTYKLHVRQH